MPKFADIFKKSNIMKWVINFFLLLVIGLCSLNCQKKEDVAYNSAINIDSQISHDLNLPNWGPYTKKYVGISHIPNIDQGLRYDLSVFPTIYNQEATPPDVLKKGNFFIWEAAPNLKYYSYRHELEWKDRVYADISYSFANEDSRLITMNLINNTDIEKTMSIHMVSSMHFPPLAPHKPEDEILIKKIELPENGIWIDGLDYKTYTYKNPGHRNQLAYDGMLRGEVRENGQINGNGIEFAKSRGDKVIYEFDIPKNLAEPVLYIRYKSDSENDTEVGVSGTVRTSFKLTSSNQYTFIKKELGKITDKHVIMEFEAQSGNRVVIDGFAIINKTDDDLVKVSNVEWNPVPEVIDNQEMSNSIILKYKNSDIYYGLYWDQPNSQIIDFKLKDLPSDFNTNSSVGIQDQEKKSENGFLKDVVLSPINVPSNSIQTIHAYISSGTLDQVRENLANIKNLNFNEIKEEAKSNLHKFNVVPDGEKYLFSQERMSAVLLSNIVYPIYTQNQYIRHSAPGRKWDCLYTWDSGFIGIGLNQLDTQRSIENLNVYLSDPLEQSAFIDHGTPLPVQFYQFLEIWNKTQSKDFLAEEYPKLKYYYDFLSGKIETSTTNNLKSGLIRTWDYFYNSGGWDDYPAQQFVHENKLTKKVTPVISTAHLIRIAKIMRLASRQLQIKQDFETYQNDIDKWAVALNQYSWDDDSGYYSYVIHNESGNAEAKLMFENHANYNMGLDGISPIISGISNNQQILKMMANLKTKGKIWSDVGLSTIDQSAPYYNKDGYWNGHVWMPHQWFIWKSMLDLGEDDFAFEIADTALNLWKKETEDTYNSNEYFSIETGKGKGWYQFGGLSAPVLSWFSSYYEIGTFTTGFDVWIMEKDFNKDFNAFEARLRLLELNNKPFTVLLCLNPEFNYDAYWNDQKVKSEQINKGTISITLKRDSEIGNLRVVKNN